MITDTIFFFNNFDTKKSPLNSNYVHLFYNVEFDIPLKKKLYQQTFTSVLQL